MGNNNWDLVSNKRWGWALAWRLLDLVEVAEVPRPLSLDLHEDEDEVDDDGSRTLSESPPASCSWCSFCSRSAISGKIINVFLRAMCHVWLLYFTCKTFSPNILSFSCILSSLISRCALFVDTFCFKPAHPDLLVSVMINIDWRQLMSFCCMRKNNYLLRCYFEALGHWYEPRCAWHTLQFSL